jgi:broad specificity phosphatase PhoE
MDKDQKTAKEDFLKRMGYYADVYEEIGPEHSSIKVYNFGEKIEKKFFDENRILTDIASFVGSVNLTKKNVYLSRHGETFFNEQDRIGGDSELTDKGVKSAEKMADYFSGRDLIIFTSAKIRTIQTGSFFAQDKISRVDLDEINSGICDSMTYEEISDRYPDISSARSLDKFNFCYPDGESYQDLIHRVRRVVADIESQKKDILIVAHRAVNRCILSYFVPTEFRDVPYIDMPLDTVFKISPKNFEYEHEIIKI